MEIDQRKINFLNMLEAMYQVNFQSTRDFKEVYARWKKEGSPVDLSLIHHEGTPKERKVEIIELDPLEYTPRFAV